MIRLHKALSSESRSPPSRLRSSSTAICLATSDSRHHNHRAKLHLRLSRKEYQAKHRKIQPIDGMRLKTREEGEDKRTRKLSYLDIYTPKKEAETLNMTKNPDDFRYMPKSESVKTKARFH
ncbi:hypothetical protein Bca4012_064818 [Brassica carinata]